MANLDPVASAELPDVLASLRRNPADLSSFKKLPPDDVSIPDEAMRLECLQAKLLNGANTWQVLVMLGDYYCSIGRHGVAYFCYLSSLDIHPSQPEILDRAHKLALHALPPGYNNDAPDLCMVSVIMPTYNRPDELREAVESVMRQTLDDFELIVINDGGCDVSDLLAGFNSDKIKYVSLPVNKGLSGALNEGLRKARGRYISYLDDDDVYYPRHLEILVRHLETDESVGCAYSDSWRVYGDLVCGTFVESRRERVGNRPVCFDADLLRSTNYISTLNFMFRRSCLSVVGLFREDFSRLMDWEMLQRFNGRCLFFQLNEITGEYRWKDNNMSLNKLDMYFYGDIVRRYYRGVSRILFDLVFALRSGASLSPAVYAAALQVFNAHNEKYALSRAILPMLIEAGLPSSVALYRAMLIEWMRHGMVDCIKMLHSRGQLFQLLRILIPLIRVRVTRVSP